MKWIKDQYISEAWLCPKCGAMVQGDGYGGCDYKFCPYCDREQEGKQNENKN